jgi:hypothetical protein
MEPEPAQQIKLLASYTAGSGTMTFDYNATSFSAIVPGALVDFGTNRVLIYGTPNQTTGVTTVIGGQQGSTDASVTYNGGEWYQLGYINPRFSPYDISVAVNDELLGLSSPNKGLGQILYTDATFIPTYQGYDLGTSFDTVRSRVLEVSYAKPSPDRSNPLIRRGRYRVIRNTNQAGIFPSGNGIILYDQAYPGFPIHVTFIAPFSPLVNLTDDVDTVGGMPVYMQDILDMGVELRLVPDREIQRNSLSFQPDPRKAPEVPATAVMHSTDSLLQRYRMRIDDEASNLKRAWKNSEGF